MRAESDLPTGYKYAIIQKISTEHPGWDIVSIGSTTDLTGMIHVCGKLDAGRRVIPFYMMVTPGDPPYPGHPASGLNDDLDGQVRAICAERGFPLD